MHNTNQFMEESQMENEAMTFEEEMRNSAFGDLFGYGPEEPMTPQEVREDLDLAISFCQTNEKSLRIRRFFLSMGSDEDRLILVVDKVRTPVLVRTPVR